MKMGWPYFLRDKLKVIMCVIHLPLIFRVQRCINDGTSHHVLDPTPDKVYQKRKMNRSETTSALVDQGHSTSPVSHPSMKVLPTLHWSKEYVLKNMPDFNDINIGTYVRNSGKRVFGKDKITK